MSLPKYCLDTHPLIWYYTGQKTLSSRAKKAIDEIFSGKATGFISAIVLLEALHVSYKHKGFIFPKFLKSLRLENIIIVSLDKNILNECFKLAKSLNIHDRVIVATANVTEAKLVTKDKKIRSLVKTIW